MDLSEIKDKLEQAYNDENWNIIEELIETLSYSVEINDYGDDDWPNEELDDEID
jgi:hypothetical protein|tara:strand:+ start:425 stop:586 length:162 start_codon:yes stop_codon:yes gene_type:complete